MPTYIHKHIHMYVHTYTSFTHICTSYLLNIAIYWHNTLVLPYGFSNMRSITGIVYVAK